MKSFGEFISDVVFMLVNGIQGLILFIMIQVIFGALGAVLGSIMPWVDAEFLHWHWTDTSWMQIGIFGTLGTLALYLLLPALFETIQVLLSLAGVLAVVAWVLSGVLQQPFTMLYANIAVWFFPVVFVLWLSHCATTRRKHDDE